MNVPRMKIRLDSFRVGLHPVHKMLVRLVIKIQKKCHEELHSSLTAKQMWHISLLGQTDE